MAKVSKKQAEAMNKAFANAQTELNGANLKAYATSFVLETSERKAFNLQLNGAILLNDSELSNILGVKTADGNRSGGMKDTVYAVILDKLAEAVPEIVIDAVNINDAARLFALDTFTDPEKDENGEPKANPKADAKKRAVKRLLNTETTAQSLIDAAKIRGGVLTLDKLYKDATRKGATDSAKRNYIFACWALDFAPAFESTVATPEAFAMWHVKASDYKTILEYTEAMNAEAQRVYDGDFANGTHKPTA